MDSKATHEVMRLRSLWPEMKRAVKGSWVAAALVGAFFAFLAALANGDPGLTGENPLLAFVATFVFVTVPAGVILSGLCLVFIVLSSSRSNTGSESI